MGKGRNRYKQAWWKKKKQHTIIVELTERYASSTVNAADILSISDPIWSYAKGGRCALSSFVRNSPGSLISSEVCNCAQKEMSVSSLSVVSTSASVWPLTLFPRPQGQSPSLQDTRVPEENELWSIPTPSSDMLLSSPLSTLAAPSKIAFRTKRTLLPGNASSIFIFNAESTHAGYALGAKEIERLCTAVGDKIELHKLHNE